MPSWQASVRQGGSSVKADNYFCGPCLIGELLSWCCCFSLQSVSKGNFSEGDFHHKIMQYCRTDDKVPGGSYSIVNECSTVITCRLWRQTAVFCFFSVENVDLEFVLKNELLVSRCTGVVVQLNRKCSVYSWELLCRNAFLWISLRYHHPLCLGVFPNYTAPISEKDSYA